MKAVSKVKKVYGCGLKLIVTIRFRVTGRVRDSARVQVCSCVVFIVMVRLLLWLWLGIGLGLR